MSDDVISWLRRLEAESTDGPWCVADNGQDIIGLRGANGGAPVAGYGTTAANAELIVEVRNLLPALLDIAEHAAALIEENDRVEGDPDAEMDWRVPLIEGPLRAALARLEETR